MKLVSVFGWSVIYVTISSRVTICTVEIGLEICINVDVLTGS